MSRSRMYRDGFRLLAWIPVGIFFTRHIYSVATISGASMQPTFNPAFASSPLHHDVVLLDRWTVGLNIFRRGDVVTLWSVEWSGSCYVTADERNPSVYRSPQNPKLLTTKRIIALEGDLASLLPFPPQLSNSYFPSFQVHPLPPSPPTPIRIPPGHCWVEGDSHYHSRDSNTFAILLPHFSCPTHVPC